MLDEYPAKMFHIFLFARVLHCMKNVTRGSSLKRCYKVNPNKKNGYIKFFNSKFKQNLYFYLLLT